MSEGKSTTKLVADFIHFCADEIDNGSSVDPQMAARFMRALSPLARHDGIVAANILEMIAAGIDARTGVNKVRK
jgi:hypothetical protein